MSCPNPSTSNAYFIYKFIAQHSSNIVESYYKEAIKQGYTFKTEYVEAIRAKIATGEFKNPLTLQNYFGTQFDYIGFDISSYERKSYEEEDEEEDCELCKWSDNCKIYNQDEEVFPWDDEEENKDAYCKVRKLNERKKKKKTPASWIISLYFVKNNTFADSDTYDFGHTEYEVNFDFHWQNTFRYFFNNNLLIVESESAALILSSKLLLSKVKDYHIKYLNISKVAKSQNLPTYLPQLRKHFSIETTEKDEHIASAQSLAHIASELIDLGVNLEDYVEVIVPETHKA